MHQFFVESGQVSQTEIEIIGNDVNHVKNVLRMKQGEHVRISDEAGETWFCELDTIKEQKVTARILYKEKENSELPSKIYLFQGLPKGDKMEWIIQKTVELGVFEVIPVAMRNCVVKLDEKKAASKVKRWQTIAESAAKQAKRSLIPNIHPVMDFKGALEYAKDFELNLLPYENESGMGYTRQIIGNMDHPQNIGVFIGPEGGFAQTEIDEVMENENIKRLSLGKRILRTETAGITMLSILLYHLED